MVLLAVVAICPAVCPAKPVIPPDKGSLKMLFVPIGIFIEVIGFVIYSIVFVIVVMVSISLTTTSEYKKLTSNRTSHSSFFLTSVGQAFVGWISRLFAWWGQFVANYWFLVIPVTLVAVAACCGGLKFFKVTTNPACYYSCGHHQSLLLANDSYICCWNEPKRIMQVSYTASDL